MCKGHRNMQNQLFWAILVFFALGFVHISLSIIGLVCIVVPFIQYAKYKEKVWCKVYCPRAGFFNRVISKISLGLTPPKFITSKGLKTAVIYYFGINLFFVTMSTLMVTLGRIEPIEQVRLFIVWGLPFKMPQLLDLQVVPNMLHLGYRIYSVLLTSFLVGSILGILYKPRTWCAICPINTLTIPKKRPSLHN